MESSETPPVRLPPGAGAGVGLIQKITAGQIDLANTVWPVSDRFSRETIAPAGHGSCGPPTHTG